MRSHPVAAALASALVAAALTTSAVLLPWLQGAPLPTVPDVAVTGTFAACATYLVSARLLWWALAMTASAVVWTLVGFAPLLPPDQELALSRLALAPHGLVVASLAIALAGRARSWAIAAGIVALGAVVSVAPLALLGALVLLTATLAGRRPPTIRLTTAALGVLLILLDQSTLGPRFTPPALMTSVDGALIAMAVLATYSLSQAHSLAPGFEPTGTPRDVERWLAGALGDPQVRVTFPGAESGAAVDLAGYPQPAWLTASVVAGPSGRPVAYTSQPVAIDPSVLPSLTEVLESLGQIARKRADLLHQGHEVSRSRSRLVSAADAENRALQRQLHESVLTRLDAMSRLLEDRRYGDLAGKVADTRREIIRHARGLDPLAGRSLTEALAVYSRHGVRISIDPSVTEPAVARTAWFVVTEALSNATKHAPGAPVSVSVRPRNECVYVVITDGGPGGADPQGAGLLGLADRVAALGGTLEVASTHAGTLVEACLPGKGNPSHVAGSPGFTPAAASLSSQS